MQKEVMNSLIEAAHDALNKLGDGKNHTVAAAVITGRGTIITGVNISHFTGGPCAEIAAVACAISAGEKDIAAVVAIGDKSRGLLTPCGRCRQMLLDWYPDCSVIVQEHNDYLAKPVRELLPGAYTWSQE